MQNKTWELFVYLFVFFFEGVIGPGKKDMVCCAPCTSAAIRTNFPMKPQCGIYYFEIRVLQKGQDGQFAIGFCRNNNKTDKLPG